MSFDLTDLSLFLHVTETGSITRGAARAHLALPSASERIRGMEETLGVQLLERGRRGVHQTPAGRALAHHARVVLQQIDRLRAELGDYAHGLKGHVRLLANTSAVSEFLPEVLGTFLTAHPSIDVDLEEKLSFEIVQAIAEGRAELGIVANTVDLGVLQTFPFRHDTLVAVTAREHRLAGQRQVGFAELLAEPFIGLGEGSALQEHLAGHAARLGRRLNYRVRLRSFDAVCRLVERGVGISVMPEAAARRCQRSMAIRRLSLNEPWAQRDLLICVRDPQALSIPARLLMDALRPASPKTPSG
ncbi:LysR family transcriptional regulator [Hyalangium versicolor]|uniref:LysR family transcriptional regulator n=1 Tax=Hyalangium versicolor TaxID=2861190 RepID=UPI001CCABA7C|nr:LysR family transcriptional regulator [Hyalangium versicolor]